MGTCVCGSPIALVPRACRLEDHAMLWPPVRVNADGSEHACRAVTYRRMAKVVEPVPPVVQAAVVNAQAAAETSASVERLATVLADESQARQDYFRQRAASGRPAGPSVARPSYPAVEGRQADHAPTSPAAPAASTPQPTLAERLNLESEAG